MRWSDTLRSAAEAMVGWRLRSLLTALGILVGVAAVIVTVGIGQGSQRSVAAQITSLGTNLLVVTPGSTTSSGGVRGGFGSSTSLTLADAVALRSKFNAPDVSAVAPLASQEALPLVAGNANWTASVSGTTPDYRTVRSVRMAQGSFFTADDVRSQSQVAVLGPLTASNLFGEAPAVGRSVAIGGVPFTVVGVLASQGSAAGTAQDDQALVPVTVAQDRLSGGPFRRSLSQILLTATSPQTMGAAQQEATSVLAAMHGVPIEQRDFTITAQDQLISTATSVNRTLTFLLTGIAAISLLVGGIGVMNIMLVSVTERVTEIGLRKALGARSRDIRRQFLTEAAFVSALGAVVGVGVGVATAEVLPRLSGTAVVVSPPAIAAAVGVAVGVGLGFGVYPAARAARLAPIEALRSA